MCSSRRKSNQLTDAAHVRHNEAIIVVAGDFPILSHVLIGKIVATISSKEYTIDIQSCKMLVTRHQTPVKYNFN
jgi:regulator of extracellular matrix RemA (YlzA/DUF370 family)